MEARLPGLIPPRHSHPHRLLGVLQAPLQIPNTYSKPFNSDVKRFLLDRVGMKDWDEQIYYAPSAEFKFNSLIRDGCAGEQDK